MRQQLYPYPPRCASYPDNRLEALEERLAALEVRRFSEPIRSEQSVDPSPSANRSRQPSHQRPRPSAVRFDNNVEREDGISPGTSLHSRTTTSDSNSQARQASSNTADSNNEAGTAAPGDTEGQEPQSDSPNPTTPTDPLFNVTVFVGAEDNYEDDWTLKTNVKFPVLDCLTFDDFVDRLIEEVDRANNVNSSSAFKLQLSSHRVTCVDLKYEQGNPGSPPPTETPYRVFRAEFDCHVNGTVRNYRHWYQHAVKAYLEKRPSAEAAFEVQVWVM
ncbi:hypothetical protein OHC33_005596 [Knufia fluminis]|uniref:Uncharacterized protein n=2 Tax=Knufia TaxID=430999 RepID=A0AAN8ELL6_9EURO|nr:hypothetical protein OHC33_005596 [Knufia fluminis]